MNRFQQLKGIEFLNPLLELLPSTFKVMLVGRGAKLFKLSDKITCEVLLKEEVLGVDKFNLLSSAKTLIVLSNFESFSMAVADALACNTVCVCWDTCGISEVVKEPFVRSVRYRDVGLFANEVLSICNDKYDYPRPQEFCELNNNLKIKYTNGIRSITSSSAKPSMKCKPLESFGFVKKILNIFKGQIL